MSKNQTNIEYWYDTHHTGVMRIIDNNTGYIYGSDPSEKKWKVQFSKINNEKIMIDFRTKKTHHGQQIMTATYIDRRNSLLWNDGNVWKRIRLDPKILLNYHDLENKK